MFYHKGTLNEDLMRGSIGKIGTKIIKGLTRQHKDLDLNLCLV